MCAAAAVLVLAAGCGNQPALPATSQTQDDAGGRPLGFGFTTVAGTALQGPVFAQPLQEADGFVAVMTLTGDPIEVYDALAGQAAQLGFSMESARRTCTFVGGDELLYAPDGRSFGWTDRPDEADILYCGTTADISPPGDAEFGTTLHLAITQGEYAGETQSTVTLDLRRYREVPGTAPVPAPEPGVRGLGRQVSWEQPDRFGVESDGLSMDVAEGSSLAGPVGALATCAGGYFAVLEVSEDLTAVTGAYEDQIEDHGFQREPAAGPGDVRSYGAAGGGTYTLSPVADENGDWLLVTRCND